MHLEESVIHMRFHNKHQCLYSDIKCP